MILYELLNKKINKGRRLQKRDYSIKGDAIVLIDQEMYNVEMDYIIDTNLNLAIGHFHMFIADYQPVVYAGRIKINNNGHVVLLDNNSGHYQPKLMHLEFAKKIISELIGAKIIDQPQK